MAGNQTEHVSNPDQYVTIAADEYTWEQVIKKSRFIVNMARVTSEEEAREVIDRINKEHNKATHNVWSYMLGDRDQVQRYSDDGEPAGTAGVPMLEVLKNNEVHDVAAVVTRYFGGIKLGAGGLVRAYAGTVAGGIAELGLVQRIQRHKMSLRIGYKNYEPLKYWLEQHEYVILDTQYDTGVTLVVPVSDEEMASFETDVTDLLSGQVTVEVGDVDLFEVPYEKRVTAQTSSLK